MLIGNLRRIGTALSVAACAVTFGAAASQSAHAASAYNAGPIAFGTGFTPYWTVVDVGTKQQHTITPAGGGFDAATMDITFVEYSPDARRVAFVTGSPAADSAGKVWLASADGSDAHLLTGTATGPIAWSPDGTQILFAANGIQAVPADGSTPPKQVIAPPRPSCRIQGPSRVTNHYAIFYWQTCSQDPGLPLGLIYGYRPGDTSPQPVVADEVGPNAYAVSPDGSRIAKMSLGPVGLDLAVRVFGGNGAGYGVPLPSSGYPTGDVPFVYGPSGDLAWAYQAAGANHIDIVAGLPWTGLQTIVSEPADASSHPIRFLDWANGPSNLPTRPIADRVGGADRIATAIDASRWTFDTRDTSGRRAVAAVLTRDDLYPDALAGTALAAQMAGPLLLTPSHRLNPAVGEELTRILVPGSTVYLLGGAAALSPAIADAVRQLGYDPVRIGGADRYETAVAIATAISGTTPKAVLLATGTNFPDALTAGAAAGQERYDLPGTGTPNGGVVLLTDGTAMPLATLAYLNSVGPTLGQPPLYAVGGPASAAMRSAVPWWTNRINLVGVDRYDTAAAVAASALYGNGAPGRYTMAAITTGTNFPDAMSGGALAGSQDAPLLLTGPDGLSPAENAVLRNGHLDDIAVIGGPAAVSNRVLVTAADTAFGPHTWGNAIDRFAPPLR